MADTEPSELIEFKFDDAMPHGLSEDTTTTTVKTDFDGVGQVLSHTLADTSSFVSSAATYDLKPHMPQAEACDTGQQQDGLARSSGLLDTLHHNSQSGLTITTDRIFSNGTALFTSHGSSEVLLEHKGDTSGTFAGISVDSLPEGHVISIPDNILPGSVIVSSQSNDGQFQQSVVEVEEGVQLVNEQADQMVQQIETGYDPEQDQQCLQLHSGSDGITSVGFTQPQDTITVSASPGFTLSSEMLQNVLLQITQQQAQKNNSSQTPTTAPNSLSFTLVTPTQNTSNSPPLGSSQNPIRIIQQGNRYTPMQHLTPDQLQQIMQVVQQQHANKSTQDNGGAVIFNPETNTRIMYRVIYPSELHKVQAGVSSTTASQEQQTASSSHQKRPYRKKKDLVQSSTGVCEEEDKDKIFLDAQELSKEQKEERKKHRPRTRSGRVSKPPKHMVQDYKHIHVLDWDEDYDDSDGGYSDFKHSDGENKAKRIGEEEHSTSPEFFQALGSGRPKNHKCQTCDKSYIGQAGLARHYRLTPSHYRQSCQNGSVSSLYNGSLDGEDSKDASIPDGSSSRMSDCAADSVKTNCNASSIENMSEDSNTQDSLISAGATSPVSHRGRGRGGFRGRWAHLKYSAQIRRKNKLRELIKHCTDEELMETVLPRLVTSVSLWEYLMMKSENGGARPQVDVIYQEFEALWQHVRQVCADYLEPLSLEELQSGSLTCKVVKVSDKLLAQSLNLETKTYKVRDVSSNDTDSFSGLHKRVSDKLALSEATTVVADIKPELPEGANSEAQLAGSVKRPGKSQKNEESITKRAKTSSPSSQNSGLVTLSVPTTLTSKFSTSTENHVSCVKPELLLSSATLSTQLTQPSSNPILVTSSFTSSALPSSLISTALSSPSTLVSSKVLSTPVTSRSPFIHISRPVTTKSQNSSTSARKQNTSTRGGRSQPVMSHLASVAATKNQVLPYIVSGSSSFPGLPSKVMVAGTGSQVLQTTTVPLVLASSGSQHLANTTVLLTTAAGNAAHKVIVRQPNQSLQLSSQSVQLPTHIILSNQPQNSISLKGSSSSTSVLPGVPSIQTQNLATRSLLGIVKPAEVRVSRQLFHQSVLSPPTSSLPFTNGFSSDKCTMPVMGLQSNSPQLSTVSTLVSAKCLPSSVGNGLDSMMPQTAVSSKTLVTPPSGQQYVTSPNRTTLNSHLSGVDDISVLTGMELSSDDLGTLNTSSESLNGSLNGCGHLADSLMTSDLAATSSGSQLTEDGSSLVDMAHLVSGDMSAFDAVVKNGLADVDGLALVSGSCPSFVKTEDSLCLSHSLPPLHLSSLTKSPSFLHAPVKSPLTQDNPDTYQASVPARLSDQIIGGVVDMESPLVLPAGPTLTFAQQGPTPDSEAGGFSAISSDLTQDSLHDSMLNQPISGGDSQDMDVLCEAPAADSGSMDGEGQFLLSESSNIYQAEDGTFIIQGTNGQTYQLQGAQGLPIETVQALISQWNSLSS